MAGNVGINSSASHSHLFGFCISSFFVLVCVCVCVSVCVCVCVCVTQFIELQALTFDMPIGITEKLCNKLQGISIFSNFGSLGVTI